MPDLTDDLAPVPISPLLRPGGEPVRRVRDDDQDRPRKIPIDPEAARLLAMARGLLETLLNPVVDDTDAATRDLLRVAQRTERERRGSGADVSAGLPLAAMAPETVADVERVLTEHASAPLPGDIAGRAAMAVEFAAGVEADTPGAIEAFVASGGE